MLLLDQLPRALFDDARMFQSDDAALTGADAAMSNTDFTLIYTGFFLVQLKLDLT